MIINELVKWELAEIKADFTHEEIYPTHTALAKKTTTPENLLIENYSTYIAKAMGKSNPDSLFKDNYVFHKWHLPAPQKMS